MKLLTRSRSFFSSLILLIMFAGLQACGGGGAPVDPIPGDTYSLGGNITGLAGSGLRLGTNGGDTLSVNDNGNFTFASQLSDGSSYVVTVAAQPSNPSQTCSVTNGSGSVAGSDIADITINCIVDNFTIGGTVSGLTTSGLVLQNNGGDNLTIDTDGNFSFDTSLADLSSYNVTVNTHPVSETCVVNNTSGSISGTNVTSIEVLCNATSVTVQPTYRFISNSQNIVLQFDESMKTVSLNFGGSLGAEATAVWSTTNVVNDTLTLSPTSSWSTGIDRTLTVDVTNLADQPIPSQALSYDILGSSTRYVNSSAVDDSGDGLMIGTAFRSIQAAIASVTTTPAMILVNEGNYDASTTTVTLQEGISLYGGYNADFTDRKSRSYVSSILNTTSNWTLTASGNMTSSTIVDGFSINAGGNTSIYLVNGANILFQNNSVTGGNGTGFMRAFDINASSPIIRNNTIVGGSGSSGFNYGIHANNGSQAQIYNNLIIGGLTSTSYGIYINSSNLSIYNNVIIGGTGSGTGIGGTGTSTPIIRNNTISGGVGIGIRFGVSFRDGITPSLDNNNIFNSGGGAQCIRLSDVASLNSLRNNNLYSCQILYFHTEDTPVGCDGLIVPCTTTILHEIRNITDVNNLPIASNNISIDASFASEGGTDNDLSTLLDNDWHLSNSSPASVRTGGLNGSDDGGWVFDTDKDGVIRPTSNNQWSIGAYQ